MDVLFEFDTVSRKSQIVSPYLEQIREIFSAEDKSLIFLRRRTGRQFPMRKYAITNKGYFDAPFFEEIYKTVKIKFPSLSISLSENFVNAAAIKPIADRLQPLNIEPRDYQQESALLAINKGKGIIVLPTSAGKTLVIALIAQSCLYSKNFKTLIVVPNIQLVQQTHQDLLDYGVEQSNISKWSGNYDYQNTNIVVANDQILLSEKQDRSVLNQFDVIIVDECHKMASAEKITKLIKGLKCKHKLGLTGSLPAAQFDVWSLNRIFGSVIYHKKSVELREKKHISNVRVVSLKLNYKNVPKFSIPSMADPTAGYQDEIVWLHTNQFRNSVINKLVSKLDTNTLILVDRIAHGEHLLNFLNHNNDSNKSIHFIQGSVEVEERETIRKLMEETHNVVCIAISKIFSTGISIKNLHNVVFAAIGKARIKIIQSIGRSLRLHHTKTIATIYDIADTNLTYGNKHYLERTELYTSENIPIISKELTEG
jgi:superfamily II DNA or RNA helicase